MIASVRACTPFEICAPAYPAGESVRVRESVYPFDFIAVLNRLSLLRFATVAAVQPAMLREGIAGRPPAPPLECAARDWALLLLTSVLAAALALRSDRARPSLAAAASLLPALIGVWWCNGGGGEGADEDRALALLWSLVGLAFVGVFCAAMLGVGDKVRESDLECAMSDTLSLLFSFAPAAHTALLWLSKVCMNTLIHERTHTHTITFTHTLYPGQMQYSNKTLMYMCTGPLRLRLCSGGRTGRRSARGCLAVVAAVGAAKNLKRSLYSHVIQ